VEKMLPDFLRRRSVIRQETLWPNKRSRIWSKFLNDANLLTKIKTVFLANDSEV
jgi:hypothetical protein